MHFGWFNLMYEVRPSGIHGHGLFATQFIPADTVLGDLTGHLTHEDGPYVLWLSDTEGFRVENDLKFINHAKSPNAVYYDDLTVAAIVDIHPGQEITHHYDGDEAVFGHEGTMADADFDTAPEHLEMPAVE